MADRSALHKTKTFIPRWQLTVIAAVSGVIATKTEPLLTQANAFFCERTHRVRSIAATFFIIKSRASHTLRYPQHIRRCKCTRSHCMPSCHNSNKSALAPTSPGLLAWCAKHDRELGPGNHLSSVDGGARH
jgi:hypothetical protein